MGSKHSKSNKEEKKFLTKKQILKKYGRLDWACDEPTNKEKGIAGKRYEGHGVLINLHSGHILQCNVIESNENGLLVNPVNISGISDSQPEKFDYSQPIPFDRFYHVFLQS